MPPDCRSYFILPPELSKSFIVPPNIYKIIQTTPSIQFIVKDFEREWHSTELRDTLSVYNSHIFVQSTMVVEVTRTQALLAEDMNALTTRSTISTVVEDLNLGFADSLGI